MPTFARGQEITAIKAWVASEGFFDPGISDDPEGFYDPGPVVDDPEGFYDPGPVVEETPNEVTIVKVYAWDEDGEHLVFDGTTSLFAAIPVAVAHVNAPIVSAVQDNSTDTIPPAIVDISALVPSVRVDAALAVPAAVANVTAPTPAGVQVDLTLPIPVATAGVSAPKILTDATLPVPVATVTVNAPQVTAQIEGNLVLPVPVATVTVAALTPGLTVDKSLPIPVATAGVSGRIAGKSVSLPIPVATAGVSAPEPGPVQTGIVDTFDRADGNGLGSQWTLRNGSVNPGIVSNSASMRDSTNGTYDASYNTAVSMDDHYVEAKVVGTPNNLAGSRLFLRANSAGSRVSVRVVSFGLYITTYTGWGSTGAADRAVGSTVASGDVIRLAVTGNVYTVYKNGASVVSWTDTGGAWAGSAARRLVGLTIVRSSGASSPGWDDFTAN